METKTQRIHREFREALDLSVIPVQEIDVDVVDDTNSLYSTLNNIGMYRSKTYKVLDSKKESHLSTKEALATIEALREIETKYPQYRIISLSKVIALMDKYNLVFGGISDYEEMIPKENARELAQYDTEVAKRVGVSGETVAEQFMDHFTGREYGDTHKYFMVAPESFFSKRLTNVKRFMLDMGNKPKLTFKASMDAFSAPVRDTDPIVLKKLKVNSKDIFFHIATAWDIEANDPEVTTKISEIPRSGN